MLFRSAYSTNYFGLNGSSVIIIGANAVTPSGQNIVANLSANSVPGFVKNPTTGYGYITINALQAAAKASLGTNGNTTSAGAVRNYQECVKSLLDNLNNNIQPVVSTTPCPVSFGKSRISEEETVTAIPEHFALKQNYPNPFNPVTTIQYDLPMNSFVTLKVYDVLGKEVATLYNDEQSAGFQSVEFDASNLPSGMYFYRLTAGTFTEIKKMLLLK